MPNGPRECAPCSGACRQAARRPAPQPPARSSTETAAESAAESETAPDEPPAPVDRRQAELNEARRIAEAEAAQVEAEAARLAEEEAIRQARAAAERAAQKLNTDPATPAPPVPARPPMTPAGEPSATGGRGAKPQTTAGASRGEKRRRGSKLTISEALSDESERVRSLAAVRRAREREKARLADGYGDAAKQVRDVIIPDSITVQELSNRMAERGADLVKSLMKMGVMATINQMIDGDTAELLVQEFGHTSKRVSEADVEIGLSGEDDADAALRPRPPVVTVMGHVDHGKHHCSTPCGGPMWSAAKLAASPSISVPIR